MRTFVVFLVVFVCAGFGWMQQYTAPLYSGDVRYVEDVNSDLTLRQVQQLDWSKEAQSPINFGYSSHAFWYYLPVTADVMQASQHYILEIDFPTINTLDVYYVGADGKLLRHYSTGTDLPFSSRPLWDDDWIFPLDNPQSGDKIFIRARTSNSLQMPIRVYQRDEFYRQDMINLLLWGAFYGLMLIMALYGFLNGLVIKDRLFIYYGAYVVASCLTIASLNGHSFAYLWPNTPYINSFALTLFPSMIICFGTAFALEYLGFNQKRFKLRYVGYGYMAIAAATAVAALMFHIDLSFWAAVETVFFSIMLLAFGAVAVMNDFYLGWYFLAGWSVFLAGASMFALNVLGLLPFNVFTVHSKEVGSAFEIIMLSLGMSAIYSHEREERNRINSAIDLMKQRLQRRINLINNKSGYLEIPLLEMHLQDIRSLDKRIHTEMGRLLVVSVLVIDSSNRRPDYIAQGDCLRALFNSRVTVFPFKTRREGLPGEVTVLLFPLHNKFEAEPILERVAQWKLTLGDQYDMHFGYAISHLTEKYEVDYIEESLDYLEEALQRHALSYSIDDVLNFVGRPGAATA